MAVLRDRVAQKIRDHRKLIAIRLVGVLLQVLIDGAESIRAVIVVGVDDGERTVNDLAGGQNGMRRGPRA